MRYWRKENDLYTGDTAPVEAVEITEQEYTEVMNSRAVAHVEPTEDDTATEQDYIEALRGLGVSV